MLFPDQTISLGEKNKNNKAWWKSHFEYADALLADTSNRRNRIDALYNNFHGKYSKKKFDEWVRRYKDGSKNTSKTKFIDYKLATGKIDRLQGEFLKRELKPTVLTINKDAVNKKLEATSLRWAMMAAEKEVNMLRGMNLEVLGGMQALNPEDPAIKDRLNPKTQNEKFMSLVLQEQIRRLDLKTFGAKTLQDLCICSECHAHVHIGRNKKILVDRIHPKHAVFEEIEGDEFLTKSGIVGFKIESGVQQALKNHGYKLTVDERKKLQNIGENTDEWSRNGMHYVENRNGRIVVWETMIYWFSVKEVYEKYVKGDDNEFIDFYNKTMSPEYYEKNKDKIKYDVSQGKYMIRKGYVVTINQARRIARDIYVDMKEQPFIIRRSDDANEIFYNYTGLLLNSVDGIRLSLQEKLQDLNDLYNAVMWQLRREIGKFKGHVLVFDEAYLTDGVSLNDVMFNISEESFITTNSNADENQAARTPPENAGVNSVNIGDVQNIMALINLKVDIQNMIDRISGINEFREGEGAVSATATQNIDAIAASRTITSPIFYAHSKFLENVFMRVIEQTKYAIGYLKDDSFDSIIGDNGVEVMKRSKDVHWDDYGVFIADPNREAEIREKITLFGQVALNSGEIRIPELLEAELAPTIQDSVQLFKEGLKNLDRLRQEEQQQQLQSQEKNVAAQIDAQERDREDRQQHEKEKIILEKDLDARNQTQADKNKAILQNQQSGK